jgi:cyclin-dependent kinase regulatory subunit CKS1
MPHYPDEIEYSDKYQDDSYEYRHVLLPKETYKKMSRNKLLSENVPFLLLRNGEASEFNNPEDGSTTNFISQSHTSCCSEEPEALTHKLDCHQLGSLHQQIPFCTLDARFQTDNAYTLI